MRWEILNNKKLKTEEQIIDALLNNREIASKEEFFSPTSPVDISLKSLKINEAEVKNAITRIKKAKKNNEEVLVYGDYDADGICSTAILWEALHLFGLNVLPHIPDRFIEGYGINAQSVENLKIKIPNLKLIVTVDNGIVAYDGINNANELGIDVIVLDHHTKGPKKVKSAATVHTTLLSGSGIAYIFARELLGKVAAGSLELAAIGTIADQLPLIGANRSIVKYGLEELSVTKRPGLKELFGEAGLSTAGMLIKPLSTYEVGFIIAPRINAMGRLKHGIESLRLLCTKDKTKARDLSFHLGSVNKDRQTIVENVVLAVRQKITKDKIIVISGEDYHEGVIGLAAGRITEEFYRPSIVLSVKGDVSKASARSIYGFNIIEAIRAVNLHSEGGGHPMAAGFSIATDKISEFTKAINDYADGILTGELLQKKLRIDCEIGFDQINNDLYAKLVEFDPTGLGNPTPTFVAKNVEVVNVKSVGLTNKHLKLKLRQNSAMLDAIWFNHTSAQTIAPSASVDVVFNIDDNTWNGYKNLQLKIKDVKS